MPESLATPEGVTRKDIRLDFPNSDRSRTHSGDNVRVFPLESLPSEERRQWMRLQRANPELQNPFFRFELCETFAKVNPGVEVAVLYRGGKAVAFFPYQAGEEGLATPVGGQIGCLHGIICDQGLKLDGKRFLQLSGLRACRFDHLLGTQEAFSSMFYEVLESPYIDLRGGFDAYRARRKAEGHTNRAIAEVGRKTRRLEREIGPLELELDCRDPRILESLILWKREQMRKTGRRDLFSHSPWVRSFVEKTLQLEDSGFRGMLSALMVRGNPIAVHFALRSGDRMHGIFFAFDKSFSRFSPGMVLVLQMTKHLAALGITRLNMGKGDERYKQMWKSGSLPVAVGGYESDPVKAFFRPKIHRTKRLISRSPLGPVAKRLRGQCLRWQDGMTGRSTS